MLEKPDLPEEHIIQCLRDDFGLSTIQIEFLPLGADEGTAVYRAVAEEGAPGRGTYFVKLHRGRFDEIVVTLPKFLGDQGIRQIIRPLPARDGTLWADLDPFRMVLYPFNPGRDAYQRNLSIEQWSVFGRALRRIHDAQIPPALIEHIRAETYTPRWRNEVREFLLYVADAEFADPVGVETASLLRSRHTIIADLVGRADCLAGHLQQMVLDFVLCHADIHAGNIHIGDDGALYLVDWDAPILAPKERDLMSIGAGLMGRWRTPTEENALFYTGYGPCSIDAAAIAYYRYERIIEDIAVLCRQLLLSDEGGADRPQSLGYLASNFLPGHTIDIAYQADPTAGGTRLR